MMNWDKFIRKNLNLASIKGDKLNEVTFPALGYQACVCVCARTHTHTHTQFSFLNTRLPKHITHTDQSDILGISYPL